VFNRDLAKESGIEVPERQGFDQAAFLQAGLAMQGGPSIEGREEGLELGREDERTRIERELAERGIELSPEAIEIIRSPVNGSSRNGDLKE